MRRTFYFIITVIYISSSTGCGGHGQRPVKTEPAKTQKTLSTNSDTIIPKHLAFVDDAFLKKLKDSSYLFPVILSDFTIVPKTEFKKYYDNFIEAFRPDNSDSPIQSYPLLSFSIYNKYNGFQSHLRLQNTEFTDLSGRKYSNKIRIYPAIDPGRQFYLVLMRETKEIGSASDPFSDLSVFYTIKNDDFQEGKDAIQTRKDIKNFQTIWRKLGTKFYECQSFSYSIGEYNKLLGNTPGYWNVAGAQTDPSSNIVVRISPAIDDHDPSKKILRLVFRLYQKIRGGYTEIMSKNYFDNMDPCPTVCPDKLTQIN